MVRPNGKDGIDYDPVDQECCPCCGTMCYSIRDACCTGRCCTCFTGRHKGTGAARRNVPLSYLEAYIYLYDCSSSDCDGYLGKITLKGGDLDTHEAEDRPALCKKIGQNPTYGGGIGGDEEEKAPCYLDDREGKPGNGVPMYEYWSGYGLICDPDDPDYVAAGKICQGQMVEMSVCCMEQCADDRGGLTCADLREEVDIDRKCSCACYQVDMEMHPRGWPGSVPPGEETIWCSDIMPPSWPISDCWSQNSPGCPTFQPCPLAIIDCKCSKNDSDIDGDGWYIRAEKRNAEIISCDCCPGDPTLPPGAGFGQGGCASGSRFVVIIMKKF